MQLVKYCDNYTGDKQGRSEERKGRRVGASVTPEALVDFGAAANLCGRQAGSEQIVNGATKLQAQATPRVGNEKITTANLATKNRSVCTVYTRVCLCVFVCGRRVRRCPKMLHLLIYCRRLIGFEIGFEFARLSI